MGARFYLHCSIFCWFPWPLLLPVSILIYLVFAYFVDGFGFLHIGCVVGFPILDCFPSFGCCSNFGCFPSFGCAAQLGCNCQGGVFGPSFGNFVVPYPNFDYVKIPSWWVSPILILPPILVNALLPLWLSVLVALDFGVSGVLVIMLAVAGFVDRGNTCLCVLASPTFCYNIECLG